MRGDQVPDADHVARYCSPRQVENGSPRWGAFQPRVGEDYLSVNWLISTGAAGCWAGVSVDSSRIGLARKLWLEGGFLW